MAQVVNKIQLSNGTRVLLVPRAEAQSVFVQVAYAIGSRWETDEIAGAAHFIEHMMFKGTARRTNSTALSRELDAVGADFNAYTSEESTAYHIRLSAHRFDLAADMLADMVLSSLFRPDDIESERGVILQEARKYLDIPDHRAGYLLNEMAYPGHGLGRPIIGTIESITTLDRDALLAFRGTHYVPANCVITVAGKFDSRVVVTTLNSTFGRCPIVERAARATVSPVRPDGARVEFLRKETVEETTINLGFRGPCGHEDPHRPTMMLMANALGGTMSSRLFEAIREKNGLSYNPSASIDSNIGVGTLEAGADVDAERADLAMSLFVDELLRLKDHGFTEQELSDAKENMRGGIALAFESVTAVAKFSANQELFCVHPSTIEDRLAALDAVTCEDVLQAAREVIRTSNANVAVIAKDGDAELYMRQLERLGE